MECFCYIQKEPSGFFSYLFQDRVVCETIACCRVIRLPVTKNKSFLCRWRNKKNIAAAREAAGELVTVLDEGLEPFVVCPFIYQPKQVFYEQFDKVVARAVKFYGVDAAESEAAVVCGHLADPRLEWVLRKLDSRFRMVWIFTKEEDTLPEEWYERYGFPVFLSREPENIKKLPVVILLDMGQAARLIAPNSLVFNLTATDFLGERVVNDILMPKPDALKRLGIPPLVLDGVLYHVNGFSKIISFL